MAEMAELREDHRIIRTTLSEVGDTCAAMLRRVAILRDRYEELKSVMARHLITEDHLLDPCWDELQGTMRTEVAATHHRQQQQLQEVEAQLEGLRRDSHTAWSAMTCLIQSVRHDMWSEELALFPAVEHLGETLKHPAEALPSPRPQVSRALAEDRWRRPRAHRIQWMTTLFFVAMATGLLFLFPPAVDRHSAAPSWNVFAVTLAPMPPPMRRGMAAVSRMTVEYHGQLMPLGRFSHEILRSITALKPRHADHAIWIVLMIMAEPRRWEDRELIWVPPGPLRQMLNMAPEVTHRSYRQLAASSSFTQATPKQLQKLLQFGGLAPMEREWVLIHRRFLSLQSLVEQDVRLVPSPGGEPERWLPILNPEGYPFGTQVSVKRAWSALLGAVRRGESAQTMEASQRLSTILHTFETFRF